MRRAPAILVAPATLVALALLAPLAACGKDPAERLFGEHESDVARCLELRSQAEAMEAEAERLLRHAITPKKMRGQELVEEAGAVRAAHVACLDGLIATMADEAERVGLDATALRSAFTAWYEERARRLAR